MVRGLRIAPIDAYIDQENATMMTLTVKKRAGPVGIHMHCVDSQTRVNGVVPESPCAEGDVRVGDVILRIDGTAVEGAVHAAHTFSSCEGDIAVTVMRTCVGSSRSRSSSGSWTDGAQARRPWSARRQHVAVSRNRIYAELITLVVRPHSTEQQQPAIGLHQPAIGLHVAEEEGCTQYNFERREKDQPSKREVVPSLRVIRVEHDSVCRNAGFFQGDIVQTVDGRTPASAEKLLDWLAGNAVNVVVSRTCS